MGAKIIKIDEKVSSRCGLFYIIDEFNRLLAPILLPIIRTSALVKQKISNFAHKWEKLQDVIMGLASHY